MEQNKLGSVQDLEAQDTQEQPKETLKEDSKLQVLEYRTLRAEEIRRIAVPLTLIQWALASFGAILAFGVQLKQSTVLLLYPFLMLWLALLWRENTGMLTRIRVYIATYIEVEDHQWERTLLTQFHPIWNYDTALTFLLLCADFIAIGIGISQDPGNIVFILVSCFCTLLTALLFFVRRPIRTKFGTGGEATSTKLVDTPA
jgi:hypothetical protein